MIKRFFTLAMMTILAITAWADDNTVSSTTIWEFSSQTVGDLTENKNINGLWLRASSGGKIQFQNLKRSGTFSDGSTWTTMTNNENGVAAISRGFLYQSPLQKRVFLLFIFKI